MSKVGRRVRTEEGNNGLTKLGLNLRPKPTPFVDFGDIHGVGRDIVADAILSQPQVVVIDIDNNNLHARGMAALCKGKANACMLSVLHLVLRGETSLVKCLLT